MRDIDNIMQLLDWNQSREAQDLGIDMSKDIPNIHVFLQPCDERFNKNVWGNCAEVLARRSDKELSSCLKPMMEWIKDMNWPGAFRILERLKEYENKSEIRAAWYICLYEAQVQHDDIWMENLKLIEI